MIYNLATHIVSSLEKRGYLSGEDNEIIIYGLFSLISKLFYAIVCVSFGICLNRVYESVLFYVAFLFVKKYAGGFHASTEGRCMIVSSVSILLSVCLIHISLLSTILAALNVALALISSIIIVAFSPVAAEEKPLSDEEKLRYKIYAIIRVAVILIIAGITLALSSYHFSIPLCTALILAGILLVAGKIKK